MYPSLSSPDHFISTIAFNRSVPERLILDKYRLVTGSELGFNWPSFSQESNTKESRTQNSILEKVVAVFIIKINQAKILDFYGEKKKISI